MRNTKYVCSYALLQGTFRVRFQRYLKLMYTLVHGLCCRVQVTLLTHLQCVGDTPSLSFHVGVFVGFGPRNYRMSYVPSLLVEFTDRLYYTAPVADLDLQCFRGLSYCLWIPTSDHVATTDLASRPL